MDQPKIERLLRLMMLLTSNNRYSIDELSYKLNTSKRTIYRYIDTFREAGFVIKKRGECFRLDKTSPYFKDISDLVHFTEEESYILSQVIDSIDETLPIKQNLRAKLASVYDYNLIAECVVQGKNSKIVSNIAEAISNEKSITLHNYKSINSKTISNRVIEPIKFSTNYVDIWGYEVASKKCKLFKISRIESVTINDKSWEYKEMHKPLILDIFRIQGELTHKIKLELSLIAYSLLIDEFPLSEKYITKVDNSKWILDCNVCSYKGVGRFVMGLLNEITIIENNEFKNYIKNILYP